MENERNEKMSKLLKNWIFTLFVAIILVGFGVLMLVKGDDLMRYLIALALIVYIVLVLADNVLHYRGTIQLVALIEMLIILALTLGMLFNGLKFLPVDGVNATVGFVMWLRAAVEIVHGFLIRSGENKTEFTLPRLLIYILFLSFGVALMTSGFISELAIRIIVGVGAELAAVVFGYITYKNRREAQSTRESRRSLKKASSAENAENNERDGAEISGDSSFKTEITPTESEGKTV